MKITMTSILTCKIDHWGVIDYCSRKTKVQGNSRRFRRFFIKANQKKDVHSQAFTLIELLVVMGIIAILVAISVPTLSSLNNAGGMNRAVNEISLLLDQARAYAMAHNTYVWVGFAPDPTSEQLTVGVVAGTTGDVADLNSTTTCTPLTKLQTYDHLTLKNISGLTGMSAGADDIADSQVGTFQQIGGGTTVTFTNIVQFSSQGKATIDKTPDGSHWIQIGLQPVRGSNTRDPNVVVFQVAALTGQVQVFRP